MRFLKILLISFILSACNADPFKTFNPGTIKAQGGVDVGNMSSEIPGTSAIITWPSGWGGKLDGKTLVLKDSASSTIKAKKTSIHDLTSPTQSSLQIYLKDTTGRDYEMIEMNGLKGVRFNTVDTPELKVSDIYLITELNDLIQITSELSKTNNGLEEGEKIISTIRLKYKGVAVTNAVSKTVTFSDSTESNSYSFLGDCYSGEKSCKGVGFFGSGKYLKINRDFSTFGDAHVTVLGTEREIPFDSIHIDGEYLIAPSTEVNIADIYASPFAPNQQFYQLKPKVGTVYLIRTIDWPSEDLIVKMRVDSIDPFQFTYEKLITVPRDELKKLVEEMNRNTLQKEMPMDEGEVTLYNRSAWENLSSASFNFQYSTSGNYYITHNDWDFTFDYSNEDCGFKPSLNLGDPRRVGTFSKLNTGSIFEIDNKDFATYAQDDFKKNEKYTSPIDDCGTNIEVNRSYAIHYHTQEKGENPRSVFGVIKVLDLKTENGHSMRFKFRRIYAGKLLHFQKWHERELPEVLTAELNANGFNPDSGIMATEDVKFLGDTLSIGENPYGTERGLVKFDKDASKVTLSDVEQSVGNFSPNLKISLGDVIGVYTETLYERGIFVLKVEEFIQGKVLKVSRRYLMLSELELR